VVLQEPAGRFGGGGQVPGVLPRLEQPGGRPAGGDLAAGPGRVILIDPGMTSTGVRNDRTWSRVTLTAKPRARIAVANAPIWPLARSPRLLMSCSPRCFPRSPDSSRLPAVIPAGCPGTAATTRCGASSHSFTMNGPARRPRSAG
jgi:hypothetical protein